MKLKKSNLLIVLYTLIAIAGYIIVVRPQLMATSANVNIELVLAGIIILAMAFVLLVVVVTLIITLFITLLTRKRDRIRPWLRRLRLQGILLLVLILATTAIIMGSQVLAYTPPILGEDGKVLSGSIASLEKVTLNDSEQWISIRGKNVNNPVLLFLAGGPGGSQIAASRRQLQDLEDDFVVISWDQPGSAKSYNAIAREDITPQRYISDGYELTKYLCNRFDQEKIYVVGESWGSALGIWLVQRHPELYHGFIGTAQMISFLDTELYCYEQAIKIAAERGDIDKIVELSMQGAPPYYGDDVTKKEAKYLMYLSASMTDNPEIERPGYDTFGDLAAPEYGLFDKVTYLLGVLNTFNDVYQQLYEVDLRKQAVKIEVPVYILEGRHDINAPAELAEEYFELLEAPRKELIWFEHSGHSPWINERDKFIEHVKRLFLEQGK